MKTKLFIEQHFHGCYGIDFNTATVDDVRYLAHKILKDGIGYIFPTLVTDTIENLRRQIGIIKQAAQNSTSDMATICGVHLEGVFLNPEKKGIHNSNLFLKPTIENFELLADDFIKIVTLAPELADNNVFEFLKSKGIKIQAGHCLTTDLAGCDGTTHTFNAMGTISHKQPSTTTTALLNDDVFSEIIADGVHVCDDALRLLFKTKQMNKIILISDCLPCTHSDITEFDFAGSKIFFDGNKATSADGTLAGSTMLLPDIVKVLAQKDLFNRQHISNAYDYHKLESKGEIEWDEDYNIIRVSY